MEYSYNFERPPTVTHNHTSSSFHCSSFRKQPKISRLCVISTAVQLRSLGDLRFAVCALEAEAEDWC